MISKLTPAEEMSPEQAGGIICGSSPEPQNGMAGILQQRPSQFQP